MLNIETCENGKKLELVLTGRLDTLTSSQLSAELESRLGDVTELVLDFKSLDYISSSGLRVVLAAQKTMNKTGSMVIKNVNETIMEVFDMTGFLDILTIE